MSKVLTPFLLLALSACLLLLYIRPAYEVLNAFQEQETKVDSALKKAGDLKGKVAQLRDALAKYESDPTARARLQSILPDSIHPVRLVIDLDALAQKNRVTLVSFELPKMGETATNPRAGRATGVDSEGPIGKAVMRVVAQGAYANIKAFTEDIERSLTLYDIVQFSLTREGQEKRSLANTQAGVRELRPGELSADIGLQVYWLK